MAQTGNLFRHSPHYMLESQRRNSSRAGNAPALDCRQKRRKAKEAQERFREGSQELEGIVSFVRSGEKIAKRTARDRHTTDAVSLAAERGAVSARTMANSQ